MGIGLRENADAATADSLNVAQSERVGEALLEKRLVSDALIYFQRALAGGAEPRRHLAQRWESWMLLGDFEKAWQESDYVDSDYRKHFIESDGGRVLVRCRRGIGDAIQFLRYAPELKRRFDALRVEGPARLLPLLTCFPEIDEIAPLDSSADHDFEIECSDLPYLFRTTIQSIPRRIPYIDIPADRVRAARQRVAALHGLKVGLVWAAGEWNPVRSLPLSAFASLARLPGLALFSLQRGSAAAQLSELEGFITDAEQEAGDIVDTAATILNLDLVISVDTMTAHLAGALRRPVWTLLQHAADWRWMVGTEISPWYPSMRLFRQSEAGNWPGVLDQVQAELARAASGAGGLPR